MPKIYEYFGIVFFFHTNDHKPVHVHARYGKTEIKIEIVYENGKLAHIQLRKIRGIDILPPAKCKEVEKVVNKYHKDITEKWEDVNIYNKKIKFTKITKKL